MFLLNPWFWAFVGHIVLDVVGVVFWRKLSRWKGW